MVARSPVRCCFSATTVQASEKCLQFTEFFSRRWSPIEPPPLARGVRPARPVAALESWATRCFALVDCVCWCSHCCFSRRSKVCARLFSEKEELWCDGAAAPASLLPLLFLAQQNIRECECARRHDAPRPLTSNCCQLSAERSKLLGATMVSDISWWSCA